MTDPASSGVVVSGQNVTVSLQTLTMLLVVAGAGFTRVGWDDLVRKQDELTRHMSALQAEVGRVGKALELAETVERTQADASRKIEVLERRVVVLEDRAEELMVCIKNRRRCTNL